MLWRILILLCLFKCVKASQEETNVLMNGGEALRQKEYPFIITFNASCTGSVVKTIHTSIFILTAKHCVESLKIKSGLPIRFRMQTLGDLQPVRYDFLETVVTNIFVLPEDMRKNKIPNSVLLSNDVAVIKAEVSTKTEELIAGFPKIKEVPIREIEFGQVVTTVGGGGSGEDCERIEGTVTRKKNYTVEIFKSKDEKVVELLTKTKLIANSPVDSDLKMIDQNFVVLKGNASRGGITYFCPADSGSPLLFGSVENPAIVGIHVRNVVQTEPLNWAEKWEYRNKPFVRQEFFSFFTRLDTRATKSKTSFSDWVRSLE